MIAFNTLSRPTIVLHWLVAAGLIGMVCFGTYIGQLESGPGKTALVQIHKSFGILVGTLALTRLVWRMFEGYPPPAAAIAAWEMRLAWTSHTLMLLTSVALPLTGILKSVTYARPVDVFGLRVIPKLMAEKDEYLNGLASIAHTSLAILLVTLIVLHVAAALRHHLVKRDDTLRRMAGLRARYVRTIG